MEYIIRGTFLFERSISGPRENLYLSMMFALWQNVKKKIKNERNNNLHPRDALFSRKIPPTRYTAVTVVVALVADK